MLASDPVGSTWGTGVRRAPQVPTWGFNQTIVAKMQTPFLMVAGVHDKQVLPERVRELYARSGLESRKCSSILRCSSHNAMWERNHLLLFKASLEWLRDGKVNGMSEGEVKLAAHRRGARPARQLEGMVRGNARAVLRIGIHQESALEAPRKPVPRNSQTCVIHQDRQQVRLRRLVGYEYPLVVTQEVRERHLPRGHDLTP